MTFDDFRNMHMNRRVKCGEDKDGNPRYLPLGKWWLGHEHRRQYQKITFAPGRETPNCYNMWRGFAYEPKIGDGHELFLAHVRQNACGDDQSLYDYVVGWMARAVQCPDEPGQTAIVLRGDQGVGKGILVKTFGHLFGRHYIHVSNALHLTGNFNAHLRDCVLLFADEAFYAGDKRHASTLKTLITEDSIMVEPKGVDTEMAANCLHLMMASNEDWVVPAGINERRFCVLDVSDKHIQDVKYFGRMIIAMKAGGYASLLHLLLNYDLSKFNIRNLPQTSALQDQKIQSFDPVHDWWFNKLMDGKLLTEHEGWKMNVMVEELTLDFIEYARQFGLTRRGSATRLGHFLRKATPDNKLIRWQSHESCTLGEKLIQRPYFYTFPELSVMRDWFDKKFGGPYRWLKTTPSDKTDIPF
jgi:hypothetical protein